MQVNFRMASWLQIHDFPELVERFLEQNVTLEVIYAAG
jgi:hypothetical protein